MRGFQGCIPHIKYNSDVLDFVGDCKLILVGNAGICQPDFDICNTECFRSYIFKCADISGRAERPTGHVGYNSYYTSSIHDYVVLKTHSKHA
jgi:hypothetical protein